MDTSSTTAITYDCPSWCQRTDHWAEEPSPGFPAIHYGPNFGMVGVQGWCTEAIEAVVYLDNNGYTDEAGLRKLAADALAAAEWLSAAREARS